MKPCTVCSHPSSERDLGREHLCCWCVATLRELLSRYSPDFDCLYPLVEAHVVALRFCILAERERTSREISPL